jgi:hypothetical protein
VTFSTELVVIYFKMLIANSFFKLGFPPTIFTFLVRRNAVRDYHHIKLLAKTPKNVLVIRV